MKKIHVQELTFEGFARHGAYADMLDPGRCDTEASTCSFFRELVILSLGHETIAAFSTLKVRKRALVVDITEYHNTIGEGMFALGGDILIHVAPPTSGRQLPNESVEAFRVPKGAF